MKRLKEGDPLETIDIAKCLMFLSQAQQLTPTSYPLHRHQVELHGCNLSPAARVFECKTCYRTFPSFQALGGHRASHKKPRAMTAEGFLETQFLQAKVKTHECSICGLEFAVGQALGGHMRRHRVVLQNGSHSPETTSGHSKESGGGIQPEVEDSHGRRKEVLSLDLNLTPYENYNLEELIKPRRRLHGELLHLVDTP